MCADLGPWGIPRMMRLQVCTSSWPQFWTGLALSLEALQSPTGHLILQGRGWEVGPDSFLGCSRDMHRGWEPGCLQPAHVGPSGAGLLPGHWL